MNEANLINQNSRVFGFLSEKAQQNRFSMMLNRLFKARGDDAMIIPMNIRPDDLYYTVSGLRKARLEGVVMGEEYRREVLELLDAQSAAVKACGFCDTLRVEAGRLYGDIAISGALAGLLKDKGVKNLAILGSGALAKSLLLQAKAAGLTRVVLFNDRIESCMELLQGMDSILEGIEIDIERANGAMEVDFSGFDAALNASLLHEPGAFPNLLSAPLMIDLCSDDSLFKTVTTQRYVGYDDILPYLIQRVYEIFRNPVQECK